MTSYIMTSIMENKHIILVGTGGAGKTSLGEVLAEFLGMEFVDSDDAIIDHEQCSIPDIFEQKGEPYFRDLEKKVFQNLIARKTPLIIGSGGGAFINDETRKLVKEKALSVFIKADIEVLIKRISGGEGRPLYNGRDPREVLEEMIAKRYPIYDEADLTVETFDEPLEKTLSRLTETLYTHLNPA